MTRVSYSLDGIRPDPERRELSFSRFDQVCAQAPERAALIYLGTRFTYGELSDLVARFATALHRLGVTPGDRVMLYLSNTPQWVIANLAVLKIGGVVVPVSPIYTIHELRYMVEHAGVTTAVCLDTNVGYVEQISGLERIVVTSLTEMLPAWKRAVGHLLNRIPGGRVTRGPRVHAFGRLLRQYPPEPPAVAIDPWRDLATIMYTGGTTALPKAVPANHMTEVAYVRDAMDEVFSPGLRPGDERLLLVMPLYHIMARGFFMAAGVGYGNTTLLMPVPHSDALLQEIERHRGSIFLGVPTLYRRLLENDRIDRYRLDSLRVCYSGGDVLPGEVAERWRRLTGVAIHQVYGSTEVGHVIYGRLDAEPRAESLGRPLKSYRCRVVDPETLIRVAPGEVGELLVSADFNLKCYLGNDRETRRSFVDLEGEIYYRTGDFVIMDASGEVRFVERRADVIKHKGARVSASEIEAVLQDHPAVVGACVVGVADDAVGERIKAVVVLGDDARGVSAGELLAWCRQRLAAYKVPHRVELRDMLPRSKVGKLLRREIRDEERRRSRVSD